MSPSPAPPERFRAVSRPAWTRSAALLLSATVAVVLIGLGLILGRIDVALLGLPLVAAVALSAARRPDPEAAASAEILLGDPEGQELEATTAIRPPPRVGAVVVRYSVLGGDPMDFTLTPAQAATLEGRVALLHSGPQELVRVEYRLIGDDAAYASPADEALVAARIVAPSKVRLDALPFPPRLQGLTGQHQSARAGDGGEFRDVHPFTAGDRLRRVDWKATARHGRNAGDLYVRRTNAMADATVLLVLDSRDDVGEQIAEWNRNDSTAKGLSSLDLAREAATSLATSYIRLGDRVGVQDLSNRSRLISHSSGNRHLWRLLRSIEMAAPSAVPFRHQRPPIIPPGAIVYLLSSFLDDQPVQLGLRWAGSGHRVIALDVLPPARYDRTNRYDRIAHRLVLMERDDRLRVLRSRGVEVIRWRDPGSPLPVEARLQAMSRPVRGSAPGGRR